MSAAWVMLFHLGFWSWAAPLGTIRGLMPNLPTFPELTPVAWVGWVGVEIFFVLSGFVIAYSAEGSSGLAFFRSRFLRLMPAVWICASLVFVVFVAGDIVPFKELIRHYLKTLALIPKNPWITPSIGHFAWKCSSTGSFCAFCSPIVSASRIFHGCHWYYKRSSLDRVQRLSDHAGPLRIPFRRYSNELSSTPGSYSCS